MKLIRNGRLQLRQQTSESNHVGQDSKKRSLRYHSHEQHTTGAKFTFFMVDKWDGVCVKNEKDDNWTFSY
jgi:16S rRNA U516 pseudouridylate synthase RsuA-like enzyme